MSESSELLTLAEAAVFLRLKPSTIRAWILHRKISYVKLGGRVFLRRSDCEALIAASFVPAREDRNARIAMRDEPRQRVRTASGNPACHAGVVERADH